MESTFVLANNYEMAINSYENWIAKPWHGVAFSN
jgi:hypothetical protein